MMTPIETAPVMNLRPQDVEDLVDELQVYHAITARCFSVANNAIGRRSIGGACCWKCRENRLSP